MDGSSQTVCSWVLAVGTQLMLTVRQQLRLSVERGGVDEAIGGGVR